MPKPNARLTMRLTPVTSNIEPERYMSLTIEDMASGRPVASFELLGEHLLDLLGNRQVGGVDGVPAWLIEPRDRAALGKLTFNTEYRFQASNYNDDTVDRWASHTAHALDAHEYSAKKNNTGMIVVRFVYYTYSDNATVLDRIVAEKQAAMDLAALTCPADK